MFDDLEALLSQAKREAYQARVKKEKVKSSLPKLVIKRQADEEWTIGSTVCLIHKDAQGNETALGLFIEHLRNGSRWLRPTAESLSPDHTEIVTGSWYLHPSIREIPLDTPHEVKAIRARFEMLIQEFDDEHPALRLETIPDPEDFDDDDEDLEDEDEDEDEED